MVFAIRAGFALASALRSKQSLFPDELGFGLKDEIAPR